MSAVAAGGAAIRCLASVPEFEDCVQLQREVWGFNDTDLVPRRMFVVAHAIGGQVLGAYAAGEAGEGSERLVGYTLAIPGIRDRHPYLHSHMLAVAAGYRNSGLGRRLKLRQRELALAQGIELIEWTFDPLEIKNAWFNLMRLGAIARRYLPNHYGLSSSRLHAGLPTDRLVAEWWLRSPRVAAALAGSLTPGNEIVQRVEVPAAIQGWRSSGNARGGQLQARNREALQRAFASGLAAIGYERAAGDDGDGGGAFLLGAWEGSGL